MHKVAQEGFEKNVDAYDNGRPEYPVDVVKSTCRSLSLNTSSRVLELASGTGKLTKALVEGVGGAHIDAVEPAANMRRKFRARFPNISCVDGTAHAIPFADRTFDALFVGQAFHWFANTASLAEMHRVLKPDGALVLIWNLEDNRVPWVAALRATYERYEGDTPQFRLGLWRQVWSEKLAPRLFTPLTETQHEHVLYVTKQQAWDRILSKSYISILDNNELSSLKARCDAILDKAFEGHEKIAYPQITTVAIAFARQ